MASFSVIGGKSSWVADGRQPLWCGKHQLLVGEVVRHDDVLLVHGSHEVLAARDHDRQLVVQADAVERSGGVEVHGQPGQHHVGGAVVENGTLVGLVDGQQLEPDARVALTPKPAPTCPA